MDPHDLALVMDHLGVESQLCELMGDVIRNDLTCRFERYDAESADHFDEEEREKSAERQASLKELLANGRFSIHLLRILMAGEDEEPFVWSSRLETKPCQYQVHAANSGCWIEPQFRHIYFPNLG